MDFTHRLLRTHSKISVSGLLFCIPLKNKNERLITMLGPSCEKIQAWNHLLIHDHTVDHKKSSTIILTKRALLYDNLL